MTPPVQALLSGFDVGCDVGDIAQPAKNMKENNNAENLLKWRTLTTSAITGENDVC